MTERFTVCIPPMDYPYPNGTLIYSPRLVVNGVSVIFRIPVTKEMFVY